MKKKNNIPEDKVRTKEHLDKQLRSNGKWKLEEWKNEWIGGEDQVMDRLLYRREKDDKDVVTTIYADDTQSRASARTLKELKLRNGKGVTQVSKSFL